MLPRQPVRGIKKINGRLKHEAADGLGIAQGIRAAQALRKRTSVGLIERREIRLQAPINSLLTAPLSGQGAALIAESIIRWPFITDHQVEFSWPLRTVTAEMPRLTTSMCSVFHGKVAFPEFAHKESLVWSERQSRGARKEISAKEAERECSTSWRTRSF